MIIMNMLRYRHRQLRRGLCYQKRESPIELYNMNKILIVDASESDRRLMAGLLVKYGYEPIAVETMEASTMRTLFIEKDLIIIKLIKRE